MTGEALQIDFRPQPSGIAVVTSAPISEIAESGKYSAFQDLIDGYASSFQKVLVFSPNGEQVVKPIKDHRVSWFSGPSTLSPTNGLLWTVMKNRSVLRDVELVRTFGPRAGIVGKAISKFTKSPHVSSSDDLVENTWRDQTGLRSAPTKLVSKLGMLRANVLSATLDWELEYLSDAGYEKDLLLGAMGLATDIYTPVGTTDPDRHPVVLWAGAVNDDSIDLIEKSAIDTQQMIENVQFIVIALGDEGDQLKANIEERDLPITVVSLSDVEPLVDLIERTWACVTVPGRDFPHGLAMLALSAGVPLISVGELAEKHGFTNHLTHVGVDPDDHEGVAYGLQLLQRWSAWALRIGSAGQKLVEERYSTRTVALKEGEQLARLARGEELESTTPKEAKVLRTYLSPATGEAPSFWAGDSPTGANEDDADAVDMYADPGFDLVAAALADISGSVPTAPSEPKPVSDGSVQGNISALFAATQADPEAPAADPVDMNADMGQDAISALFAANDADPEAPAAEPVDLNGDMGQDAISALFAANDPEPAAVAEPEAPASGDMGQDEIAALFAANDPAPELVAEPEDTSSGDMGQDAISALFAANDPEPAAVAEPEAPASGDMGQDAISALFAANDPEPAAITEPESELETTASGDMGQDAIAALFAANNPEPAVVADPEPEPEAPASGDMGQDAIAALFAANNPAPEVAAEPEDTSSADMGQDAISALFAANDPAPEVAAEPEDTSSGDMGQDAISALFAASDPAPEVAAEPETPVSGDMGQDAIAALFAANNREPAVVAEPEPEETSSGDMGQDAISALFGNDEPAPDSTPDVADTSASDAIETDSYDSVEDDLADVDLPEINMVQLGSDEEEPELSNFDDFDAEDDIDASLIESILEGKDEDPAA